MASVLEKALRAGEGRLMRRLQRAAAAVNALEPDFMALSDAELRDETAVLKARYAAGESLDDLLPEAFAAVREAARRTLGLRAFDVQLMGGAALHFGNIAEMRTGEGKTLVAVFPAFLNALAGRGVHVVTVNDFLASYQAELMGRVLRTLGMSTGVIVSGQAAAARREQYAADVTYGTNNEFGFDYLRDNMAPSPAGLVQRDHFFAVVDEVDSILIDEARTPLIVAGPAVGAAGDWFAVFADVVADFVEGTDYEVDLVNRTVGVLGDGIEKVESRLGLANLYGREHAGLISFLLNALKAKALFTKDKDYVVMGGLVMIVDEHTGRLMPDRRYSEGLHQAVEAKEHVAVQAESQTYATVTLQNYFRLYERLAGMTGTAETEAAEFMGTYGLGVVPIPTHRPVRRVDKPDLVFKNEVVKFKQVVADVAARHATGQPVLVGTTSVEKSEYLSALLTQAEVPHEVLNAKNHAGEAAVVAQAGRLGAVTVATNMAGRGTDIMLGGNAEFLTVSVMHERGFDAALDPEAYEAAWGAVFDEVKAATGLQADRVADLGGLYVLGTERHESRRIDNQLRGRSGRQGDPGETRFYLSLNDELMRVFNSSAATMLMNRGGAEDEALESRLVSRTVAAAQGRMEARNAQTRKEILKYDDVMNRQRVVIYADRQVILHGDDIRVWVQQFIESTLAQLVEAHTNAAGEVDLPGLWAELGEIYPVGVTVDELLAEAGGKKPDKAFVLVEVVADAQQAYVQREAELGFDVMRALERQIVLEAIDQRWREHLYEMDYLKEGIGLRAAAQKDPLLEYQKEGYDLFQQMTGMIRETVFRRMFEAQVSVEGDMLQTDTAPVDLKFSGPTETDIS